MATSKWVIAQIVLSKLYLELAETMQTADKKFTLASRLKL